ncbi:MAG: tripartite tricarboxylate transporter substrate binding protein [Xanthobacteraceae bacterium]|nr:tripartite tricarboxylate transporter substrate binding protein [Xanthobacteraceae bacterium]
MQRPRRRFLHLAAGAAALPITSRLARAQSYPSRPVRFIVGFPAGNAPDIIARLIGQILSERLGQQFVIENRPGAASNIATEVALAAPPDGYTIQMIVLTNVFNQTLFPHLKFNFMRDITPVGGIADAPYLIVVNPSLPVTTIPEFIAYAKANPGKINYASGGNGSSSHIFGEMLKKMSGIELTHVPYRSSFMPDLLSNQIQMTINPIPQAMEYVRTNTLRAIAATTAKRLDFLPDIATVDESVPGYVATGWYGLSMPRNTPAEFVDTINKAVNEALADPKVKARFATLGVQAMPLTPAAFSKFIHDDYDKWSNVIKTTGIKAD